MDELDKFLNSKDSLSNSSDPNSGVQFDSGNERSVITSVSIRDASIGNAKIGTAAIGTANIGTLSFNEITGGTARLGGTTNGNGLLQIFDSGGTLIIQGDNTGHHYYGTNGSESIRVNSSGFTGLGTSGGTTIKITNGLMQMFDSSGSVGFSQLTTGFLFTNDFPLIWAANSLFMRGNSGGGADIYTQTGKMTINSTGGAIEMFANNQQFLGGSLIDGTARIYVNDPITVGGVEKSAIVPTKDGYKALYCIESPDVWFMDFCKSKDSIDPIFLEVTSPPYKFIKCEDGEYQVWGKRKSFENKRFDKKTKDEFESNNKFYLQARSPKKITVLPIIDLTNKETDVK